MVAEFCETLAKSFDIKNDLQKDDCEQIINMMSTPLISTPSIFNLPPLPILKQKQINLATQFYSQRNYTMALKIFEEYPNNPESLFYFRVSYYYSFGVDRNLTYSYWDPPLFDMASIYLKKSAELGVVEAEYEYGLECCNNTIYRNDCELLGLGIEYLLKCFRKGYELSKKELIVQYQILLDKGQIDNINLYDYMNCNDSTYSSIMTKTGLKVIIGNAIFAHNAINVNNGSTPPTIIIFDPNALFIACSRTLPMKPIKIIEMKFSDSGNSSTKSSNIPEIKNTTVEVIVIMNSGINILDIDSNLLSSSLLKHTRTKDFEGSASESCVRDDKLFIPVKM
ncbi:36326_t:CDS:2 [Gigaspora margarita]|uniref:36326_t:CDS:1 n=1 Tax=Gigaspora margarita TaxID=4874 RepID=A0ABM8VVM8_GIGMA|nr:36326_t:CDS:2 [Gigaspora margarita]